MFFRVSELSRSTGNLSSHANSPSGSTVASRDMMFQMAMLLVVTAVIAIALTCIRRRRTTSRESIDVGTVSDSWLAEQRGAKRNSYS